MPKKTGKQSRLTKTQHRGNGSSSMPQLPFPGVTQSKSLYRHINELPLYIFIDCVVDKRLAGLVRSGSFTEAEIAAAWQVIADQYNQAMGDNDGRLYLALWKQIELKDIDLQEIDRLANTQYGILRHVYVEDFANRLNSLIGAKIEFNTGDATVYHEQLDKCLRRAKGLKMDLDRRKMEFESLKARHQSKEGAEPTRDYFQTFLINLCDHAGYLVDDRISTFEYCERVRRLIKFLEKQKK